MLIATKWSLATDPVVILGSVFVTVVAAFYFVDAVITVEHIGKGNITALNHNLYHQRDDLLKEVEALAARHPESMLVQSWKSNVDGYACEIVIAKVEHISNTVEDEKYRLLLSFGQHGRELITSEVALKLLSVLVGERDSLILKNETIKKELQKLIIKVVPMENYNGRRIVENGHLCERKNGRGVDTNRNWSVDWGKKEQDFDPTEEFPGTAPFSEPETRIMRDLAKSFKPHLWINVHSGMQAMFMPYDYKSVLPDLRVVEPMKQLLQKLNRLYCNSSCVIGPGGGSVGYLAHGTATDYMYEALAVPLAFTFEIYGDTEAPNEDCFRMFNPTSLSLFESTVTNWCMAFIAIFVEFETVFQSLPTVLSSTGKDEEYGTALGVRKEPNRKKRLSTKDPTHDDGKGEWSNETQTLFEFIVLFSISYLAFIWYVYLKGRTLSLPRLGLTLPLNFGNNHFQTNNSM